MGKFPDKLLDKLGKRERKDALRTLPKMENLVDFSSNDYLGFSGEACIYDDTINILKENGFQQNGATGSRLLTGEHPLYQQLENFLCKHHKSDAALVFNSGYDANIGIFSSIPQRNDLIFYDELVHASIRDGIKMGNARNFKFKHNDLDSLNKKISNILEIDLVTEDSEVYVVTESVFSMDGDTPDLVKTVDFCIEHGFHLIIDEAHATGLYGNGRDLICELGLEHKVFARIITFGKALGSHGAAVLGSVELKSYLVNYARSLIYSTALSPHSVASIYAAYQYLINNGNENLLGLKNNIEYFKQEIQRLEIGQHFIKSDSAIQSMKVSGNKKVKKASVHLKDAGFNVKPILSPTVNEGEERLRFCIHAFNTQENIKRLLIMAKKWIEE